VGVARVDVSDTVPLNKSVYVPSFSMWRLPVQLPVTAENTVVTNRVIFIAT
jgi:hypothetical protein